jgi:hypothetical protein
MSASALRATGTASAMSAGAHFAAAGDSAVGSAR